MTAPTFSPELRAEIIERIFPEAVPTPAELEARYPPRPLPEGAMVTRVGPSPTGFMHIGTLYVGLICVRFAAQTGGASYIRIEDTDKKREVEGAADFVCASFDHFQVAFDEGRRFGGGEVGAYGPYTQSQRAPIYHAFVRRLLELDLAYPCFATTEELDAIRDQQKARELRPGYYGEWAVWRHKSAQEIVEALRAGLPYVIRFRSPGDIARRLSFSDLIFGDRTAPENDQDVVVMKSDRLPTYHFAHVVDDHLMRTTHVIRGDEWLPSLPIHLQLFEALGWAPPAFAHIAPINKQDGTSRRKLSKRKDPEASVGYFIDLGYPRETLVEYLLNLANSNFEDWRKENPDADYRSFEVSFEKLANSNGPLFDFTKLNNISRDVVARFPTEEMLDRLLEWARDHDPEFAGLLETQRDYALRVLDIERHGPKARKDVGLWSEVRAETEFFFDGWFRQTPGEALAQLGDLTADEVAAIADAFLATYDTSDAQEAWFDKIKAIATAHGFAERAGDYKKNPEAFRGTVGDVAKIFRVLLTGRTKTPDLYAVMAAMGPERVAARLSLFRAG